MYVCCKAIFYAFQVYTYPKLTVVPYDKQVKVKWSRFNYYDLWYQTPVSRFSQRNNKKIVL